MATRREQHIQQYHTLAQSVFYAPLTANGFVNSSSNPFAPLDVFTNAFLPPPTTKQQVKLITALFHNPTSRSYFPRTIVTAVTGSERHRKIS